MPVIWKRQNIYRCSCCCAPSEDSIAIFPSIYSGENDFMDALHGHCVILTAGYIVEFLCPMVAKDCKHQWWRADRNIWTLAGLWEVRAVQKQANVGWETKSYAIGFLNHLAHSCFLILMNKSVLASAYYKVRHLIGPGASGQLHCYQFYPSTCHFSASSHLSSLPPICWAARCCQGKGVNSAHGCEHGQWRGHVRRTTSKGR